MTAALTPIAPCDGRCEGRGGCAAWGQVDVARRSVPAERLRAHRRNLAPVQARLFPDIAEMVAPRLLIGPSRDEFLEISAHQLDALLAAGAAVSIHLCTYGCERRYLMTAVAAAASRRGKPQRLMNPIARLIEVGVHAAEIAVVSQVTEAYISQLIGILEPISPTTPENRRLCGASRRAFQDGIIEFGLARRLAPVLRRCRELAPDVLAALEKALDPSNGPIEQRRERLRAELTELYARHHSDRTLSLLC